MSWDSIEAKTEAMLRASFKAATDSASLTPRFHCYWADSAAQPLTLPAVVITAGPAVNDGWQTRIFEVPVSVDILTSPIDDPFRAQAKAIYGACRGKLQSDTFSVDSWVNVAITVGASGKPQTIASDEDTPGGLHVIPLELTAHVAI